MNGTKTETLWRVECYYHNRGTQLTTIGIFQITLRRAQSAKTCPCVKYGGIAHWISSSLGCECLIPCRLWSSLTAILCRVWRLWRIIGRGTGDWQSGWLCLISDIAPVAYFTSCFIASWGRQPPDESGDECRLWATPRGRVGRCAQFLPDFWQWCRCFRFRECRPMLWHIP